MKLTPFTLAREVSATRKETVFLGSGRSIFRFLLLDAALAIPLVWLREGGGWKNLAVVIAAYLGAMLLVGVPMTHLLKWFCRVRATRDGIHGGTLWATPVYMTFAEMETVEPRSFLGVTYLRVTSFRDSCPILSIPCFLSNPGTFRQYITDHTSPTHPLRKSLENGYTSQKREPLTV